MHKIIPISGDAISNMCDYSFGDQAGVISQIPGAFMKEANRDNKEFVGLCREKKELTLFIDNIRLYDRPVETNSAFDQMWVNSLHINNDLLGLCKSLRNNKFIIFSGLEDTPIDNKIVIPNNVVAIYATNALHNNDKIKPMPYGLQRKMHEQDYRIDIIQYYLYENRKPTKLLYMNMGIGRNDEERKPLLRFQDCKYATVRLNKDSMYFTYDRYGEYLAEIQGHKFMLCPMGHGVDCHRNWECLYMRRVPVMRRTPYLERLFRGFPVLFVDSYDEINEEMLERNECLLEVAANLNLRRLDLTTYYNDRCFHYNTQK